MQCSLARFGGETVLFIKPDGAVELVKIASQLNIDLRALEPKEARGIGRKPKGTPNTKVSQQECFYCGSFYSVKVNKQKVWRHVCRERRCRNIYYRDRYLYTHGRENEMFKTQLVRNMRQMGMKVTIERKR